MKNLNEYLVNEKKYGYLPLKDAKYVVSTIDGYETGSSVFKTLEEVKKDLLSSWDAGDVDEIMDGAKSLKANECFSWGKNTFVVISCLK